MRTFQQKDISYEILPGTKDIWLVDLMPIQVERDFYVQYKYAPDYLKSKSQRSTITDINQMREAIDGR